MMLLNIVIGLLGLGLVVLVHEAGHLISAKLVGIEVETFSLGWGRKLVGRTFGRTEYRISVFPVGGYCRMKGEHSYAEALERNESSIPHEEGSFFSAPPWKRIIVLLSGPVANVVFAILVLAIVWGIGFSVSTYPNRIVLADAAAEPGELSPARLAGLATGDRIVAIDGKRLGSYLDLQQTVAANALRPLSFEIDRDGRRIVLPVTPALVPQTGSGYIGVYPWVEPVVESVEPASPADLGGLLPGDRIGEAAGQPVPHTVELIRLVDSATGMLELTVERDGRLQRIEVSPDGGRLGVAFAMLRVRSPRYGALGALGRGVTESVEILTLSVRSLRLLFRGVELASAVAGPVRISYFIGDAATSGFAVGIGEGARSVANFLALISVVLFFMNLLPIPVLDGGQILLAVVTLIRGRSPRPRSMYRYQVAGSVVVAALLFFALFGDILFLAGR